MACRGRLAQQRSSSAARMLWNCEVPATWYHRAAALQWYHRYSTTTTRLPVPLLANQRATSPRSQQRAGRAATGNHPHRPHDGAGGPHLLTPTTEDAVNHRGRILGGIGRTPVRRTCNAPKGWSVTD